MTGVTARVAVIGCGSIGLRHLRSLRGLGARSVVAFDTDAERLAKAMAFGAAAARTFDEAVSDATLTLVCTPPSAHREPVIAALHAGSDVFVEKPIAHTLEDADQIGAALAASAHRLAVGYNLRFHADVELLRGITSSGAIGGLLAVESHFGQYLPDWRPAVDYRLGYTARRELGGGILLDASHELDLIRWLAGEVASVAAVVGTVGTLEMDAENVALIAMRMHSGALASAHLDCVQRGYARYTRVIGSEGTAAWDWNDGVRVFDASSGEWRHHPPSGSAAQMYEAELAHVIDQFERRADPLVGFEDGRRALQLALAARRASEERHEVTLE